MNWPEKNDSSPSAVDFTVKVEIVCSMSVAKQVVVVDKRRNCDIKEMFKFCGTKFHRKSYIPK